MSLNESVRAIVDETQAPRYTQAQFALASRLSRIGELAASIAHEVNQPLAAIVTNAESCLAWLGKEQPDLDRARKAAERIVRSGHHASDVIRSIRGLFQQAPPELRKVDINEGVVDVLDLLCNELRCHEVVVELQLCRDLECVDGDRVQLQQVLVNLIRNGVEAMLHGDGPARLLLVTTCMDAGGALRVTISDSGPGLDAGTMSRVFEPFFTTKREGMGLGLSICRSIVEAHGGRLWASPRAPHGCTFQFTLPAPRRPR